MDTQPMIAMTAVMFSCAIFIVNRPFQHIHLLSRQNNRNIGAFGSSPIVSSSTGIEAIIRNLEPLLDEHWAMYQVVLPAPLNR